LQNRQILQIIENLTVAVIWIWSFLILVAGLTENKTKPSSWGLAELGNNNIFINSHSEF
jgi:hypothetical protein